MRAPDVDIELGVDDLLTPSARHETRTPRFDEDGQPYDTWRVAGTSIFDPYPKYPHRNKQRKKDRGLPHRVRLITN